MRKMLCALSVMLCVFVGPQAGFALGIRLDGGWQASLASMQMPPGSQTGIALNQDIILALLAYATASGPGAELLDFTTRIGAGVERSAAGIDDNPLTDLFADIEARLGIMAATVVAQSFDRLIISLGPNLLADVEPIRLPLEVGFDIDNGRADVASVDIPIGPYILDIGNTHNVGDGEFARVVLGLVDSDGDDNDLEQILNEITTGTSGANLDFEREPGIVGVDLLKVDQALAYFVLGFEDGGLIDELTFTGPGTAALLSHFELGGEGAAPVPEPATMLLLSVGLVALAGWGRKKMQKS